MSAELCPAQGKALPARKDERVGCGRHALLEVHSDDTLTLRDIGSSNGTSVNGKEIKQLTDVPLNDGDQVTLGHWSRLLVKAVR